MYKWCLASPWAVQSCKFLFIQAEFPKIQLHKGLQEEMKTFRRDESLKILTEATGLGLNPARFRAFWPPTCKAFKHVTA